MRHTGTPSAAAASSAPSRRSARTSLIMPAPAATAARMTSGRLVSIDTGTSTALAIAATTGTTRASSSSTVIGVAPGRVDSPPTSITSAPCSTSCFARATAASIDANSPPSEKESGVALRIAMMRQRSRRSSREPHFSVGTGVSNMPEA